MSILPADLRGLPALSIRGPWWWFVLHAGKDLENRNWPPMYRDREMAKLRRAAGRWLIHAASGCTPTEFDEACAFASERCGVQEFPSFDSMERGGIVGKATGGSFVYCSDSRWFSGPGALEVLSADALPFVPCRGQLGFFYP